MIVRLDQRGNQIVSKNTSGGNGLIQFYNSAKNLDEMIGSQNSTLIIRSGEKRPPKKEHHSQENLPLVEQTLTSNKKMNASFN